ncbi:flagellar motor protein MotB [Radiobacillus kanasensis]|uniref:flagellar motor protein MotS n=1 Tax=Radiobacillus kanasensis TaxID=2844358 RepID=UPI001E4D19CD|nr:flagellar motor protein MotS [Radiobacillus kanasensis]UFT98060.1 flagellar motor protein MotB [Radiobacillus kanasensis]
MKLRQKEKKNKGAPKWMVTYADMVTLVLVFFILLFSMSQLDMVKFQELAESFRNRMIFDAYPSVVSNENPTNEEKQEEAGQDEVLDDPVEKQPVAVPEEEVDSLDQLLQLVNAFIKENNLEATVTANRRQEGVELVLQEKVLFDSGEAEIIEAGRPLLDRIATLLKNVPNKIKVEGHTDNRPISNFRYPSNWELSGARASSVIRYLEDNHQFQGSKFEASIGYGDTKPIVPNTSSENWSKNRRVEIVILQQVENSNT